MSKVFLGTELKLNIHIEPIDGVTMDDFPFEVELVGGLFKNKTLTITKEEAKRVDSDNYLVCFDTQEVGVGKLKCRVKAFIPDGDFSDRERTEVVELDTGIEIIKVL